MGDYLQALVYIIIMVVVILLAYFVSRFLAVRVKDMAHGKYIDVVDRIVIGREKSIFILRVGEKYFLVSETNESSTLLAELTESDLIIIDRKKPQSFEELLSKYTKFNHKNEEATDKGFKDIVSSSKEILNKIKGKDKSDVNE